MSRRDNATPRVRVLIDEALLRRRKRAPGPDHRALSALPRSETAGQHQDASNPKEANKQMLARLVNRTAKHSTNE